MEDELTLKYKQDLLDVAKKEWIYIENKSELKKLAKKRAYIEEKIMALTNPAKLYNNKFFAARPGKYHKPAMKIGKDLVNRFSLTSMVDFGCGLGSFLLGAKHAGAKVKGYEFGYESAKKYIDPEILPDIEYGDVTIPINCGKFDCSLSVEVAEHIHPDKSDNFVDNLVNSSSKFIVLTAAPPGQEGVGHINCQTKEFWKNKLKLKGFNFLEHETNDLMVYWASTNAPKWIYNNGMIFKNE